MPTRERWIVYPLLFLTLGMVMRDKLAKPEIEPDGDVLDHVQCRSLTIVGNDGRPRVTLGQVAGSGQIEVRDRRGQIAVRAGVDAAGNLGLVEANGPGQRRPRAQLTGGKFGGELRLFDRNGRVEVILGHQPGGFGLSGVFFDMEQTIVPLTLHSQWASIRRQIEATMKGEGDEE